MGDKRGETQQWFGSMEISIGRVEGDGKKI